MAVVRSLAVAACVSAAAATLAVDLTTKATLQHTLYLPLADSTIPGEWNIMMVADDGHNADMSRHGICNMLKSTFNTSHRNFDAECPNYVGSLIRKARGLALQHTPEFVSAVRALETRLSNDGYTPREYPEGVYTKPYRASLLQRLISESRARGQEPRVICEAGFGAGHSSLLFLVAAPKATVFSYELGLARIVVPAHDHIDEAFPERFWSYLGESASTVPRHPDFFPESPCDLIYLDGGITYDAVAADLANFRRIANPFGHAVVLAGAAEGTAALRAWTDAAATGKLAWEGTVLEQPSVPSSDALVFGTFIGDDVGDVMVQGQQYRQQRLAQQQQQAAAAAAAQQQQQRQQQQQTASVGISAGGNIVTAGKPQQMGAAPPAPAPAGAAGGLEDFAARLQRTQQQLKR